jgi:hypothetical protein
VPFRTYGGMRGSYWVSVRYLRGKRRLRIHRRRWEDNIKMNFLELVCRGTDWIDLAQGRGS